MVPKRGGVTTRGVLQLGGGYGMLASIQHSFWHFEGFLFVQEKVQKKVL